MIYCVEDDASIRELVLYTLRASGFEARGFAESGAFWDAMCEHVPDLVLLDIMLPGEDGLEILKKLRSSPLTEQLPVILATARGSEYDKVVGLDTGVGIPKDSQSRIFERFYRVDKSRSKAVGGTGLGLSIVKHAALIQKADVRVESEPGEGSTFTVTFPEK